MERRNTPSAIEENTPYRETGINIAPPLHFYIRIISFCGCERSFAFFSTTISSSSPIFTSPEIVGFREKPERIRRCGPL